MGVQSIKTKFFYGDFAQPAGSKRYPEALSSLRNEDVAGCSD
jgi:hypothetical protein